MKSIAQPVRNQPNIFLQIHEKTSSFTAHLIGPLVFNFGNKEEAWNLGINDLLAFPKGSVGHRLGEFFKTNRLKPIAGAESHDLYHVLFGFPTTIKGEVALQFFLRGNGKKSIASFGTSLGAWFIFPFQWRYFKNAYARGKKCMDVSKLNPKAVLTENFNDVQKSLFYINQ